MVNNSTEAKNKKQTGAFQYEIFYLHENIEEECPEISLFNNRAITSQKHLNNNIIGVSHMLNLDNDSLHTRSKWILYCVSGEARNSLPNSKSGERNI